MRKVIYILSFLCVCAQVTAQNVGWRNLYLPNTPLSTKIQSLAIEKDTNFYVMTDTTLLRYKGGVWSKLPSPLNTNEVFKHLAIDNQGSVWVTVQDKGAFRYYNNVWQKYDTSNTILPLPNILYIQYDSISKFMIFGTDRGVFTFNSLTNTWKDIGLPPGYTVNVFMTDGLIISRTGEWHFIFVDKFYIYKPQTGSWRELSFPFFCSLTFDINNNLFISNSVKQLLQYDTISQSWVNSSYTNIKLCGFIFDKKNILWASNNQNGIIRVDSLRSTTYTVSNSPLYSNAFNRIAIGPTNLKYIYGDIALIQILDDSAHPTSTKDQDFARSKLITSYNNPTQERLTLQLDKNLSINQLTIQVHDLNGRLINQNMYDVKQNCVELNMVALTSGIYFVTCLDLNTQRKETIKIVK